MMKNGTTPCLGSAPCYHERIVKFVRDKNNVPLVKETVKGFHAE